MSIINRCRTWRMGTWLFVSLGLFAIIALIAPYQLPVAIYKLALITSAAWVGYWIDRGLFWYARPGMFIQWCTSPGTPALGLSISQPQAIAFAAAMMRRAIIIGAAMFAVALGA